MIPTFFFGIGVFAFGLKSFLNDMHQHAILTGKAEKSRWKSAALIQALIRTISGHLGASKVQRMR